MYLSRKSLYYLGIKSIQPVAKSFEIIPIGDLVDRRYSEKSAVKLRVPGLSNLVDRIRDRFRRDRKKPKQEPVVYRIEVDSSNIDRVAYSPDTRIMQILFNSGGLYHYYDVPEYVFESLLTARSKGKYFWTFIRGRDGRARYNYDRLR